MVSHSNSTYDSERMVEFGEEVFSWDSVLVVAVVCMTFLGILAMIHKLFLCLMSPTPKVYDDEVLMEMLKCIMTDAIYISNIYGTTDRERVIALSKNAKLEWAYMRQISNEEVRRRAQQKSNATYAYIRMLSRVSSFDGCLIPEDVTQETNDLMNFCPTLTVGEKILISQQINNNEIVFENKQEAWNYAKHVISMTDKSMNIPRKMSDPCMKDTLKNMVAKDLLP